MIALKEMQFELLNGDGSGEGVAFGFGLPVAINDGGFDTGELTRISQDSQNQVTGSTTFGRDVSAAKTWTWQMHVNTDDTPNALAALGALEAAWEAEDIVSRPGFLLPLRYRLGNRVRRVYGRPRRFSAAVDNRIIGGMIPVTASFDLVNHLTYDDASQSAVIQYNPDSTGGFVLPTTLPISTLPGGSRTVSVTNSGNKAAHPVIRFDGPITKPTLTGPGWEVSLDLGLADGEWAEIDTRPWKMTVLKNGSAGMGGRLGKRQYLTDVKIKPGTHQLNFSGQASSAIATCTVSWRNAYSSI